MKRLVVGNWKMHLTLAEAMALGQACLGVAEKYPELEIVIAPSLPWLVPLAEALPWRPPNFGLASQVVSSNSEGAYTGDVAATQLKGLVQYALVGHSERRRYHHETGASIAAAIQLLLAEHITPIVCFGEMMQSTQHKFSSQITLDLERDLNGLAPEQIGQCRFAYEPLWAIGNGHPASSDYVEQALLFVQEWAEKTYGQRLFLLYGGSVTEHESAAFGRLKVLDGLLVGGASLHAKQFGLICRQFCRTE